MLNSLSLRARLLGSFGLLLAVLVFCSGFGIRSLQTMARSLVVLNEGVVQPLGNLEAMGRQLAGIRAEVLGHILESSTEGKSTLTRSIQERSSSIQKEATAYSSHPLSEQDHRLFQEFVADLRSYEQGRDTKVLPLSTAGKPAEAAQAATREVKGLYQKARNDLDGMIAAMKEKAQRSALQASAEYLQARNLLVLVTLAGLAGMVLLGTLLTRSITRKTAALMTLAGGLASGDLTARMTFAPGEEGDELGRIGLALNSTLKTFQEALTGIQTASQSVADATSEIASGNSDLSVRTESQAASLEETASSMEELSSSIQSNAENAGRAATSAGEASKVAEEGRAAVVGLMQSMEEINQSARKIEEITSVVDGIAFQTNLLALNAAVEAARAGEQGRGFAVVATEVRTLARRSGEAAKQIKDLIRESVGKAQEGQAAAARTQLTIQKLGGHVQESGALVSQIATSSREQHIGVGEINRAVAVMDQTTQQNAALVEEAAAAAESLHDQALTLSAVVARFQTGARSSGTRDGSLDINAAIQVHSRWLMRFRGFVEGYSDQDLNADKVSCDNLCDLGRWIYGAGPSQTDSGMLSELKGHHAAFHKCAGEIVRTYRQRGKAEAEMLIGPDSEFVHQSSIVIRILQKSMGSKRRRQPPGTRVAGRATGISNLSGGKVKGTLQIKPVYS